MNNSETDVNPWSDGESMVLGITRWLRSLELVHWVYAFMSHLCLFQAYYCQSKPFIEDISSTVLLTGREAILFRLFTFQVCLIAGLAIVMLGLHLQRPRHSPDCVEIQTQNAFTIITSCSLMFFSGVLIGTGATVVGTGFFHVAFLLVLATIVLLHIICIEIGHMN